MVEVLDVEKVELELLELLSLLVQVGMNLVVECVLGRRRACTLDKPIVLVLLVVVVVLEVVLELNCWSRVWPRW